MINSLINNKMNKIGEPSVSPYDDNENFQENKSKFNSANKSSIYKEDRMIYSPYF